MVDIAAIIMATGVVGITAVLMASAIQTPTAKLITTYGLFLAQTGCDCDFCGGALH
jgi:hypothetical protein